MFKFKIGPLLLFVFSSFILGLSMKYNKATGLIYTNIINKFIREKLSIVFSMLDIHFGDVISILLILFLVYFILNFYTLLLLNN